MANYTTEVRSICEVYAGNKQQQGYNAIDNIVEKAAPLVFEKFPIFDENYRLPLEKKILRHFYTREICMETVGLWKLHFNNKMNEIMPYYNKLYESELLKFNPFYNVDLTTQHDRSNDSESQTKSKNNTNSVNELDRKNVSTDDTNASIINDRSLKENTERNQKTEENGFSDTESKTKATDKNVMQKGTTTTRQPKNLKSHELNKFLDTPQSGVTIADGQLSSTYLTDVRDVTRTENGEEETRVRGNDTDTRDVNTTENSSNVTSNDTKNNDVHERKLSDSNTEENSRFNKHKDNMSESEVNDTETTANSNTKANNMETFFEKIVGKQGTQSYSKMLQEFRDTFLNIDMMIIRDLEPLFMGLW